LLVRFEKGLTLSQSMYASFPSLLQFKTSPYQCCNLYLSCSLLKSFQKSS